MALARLILRTRVPAHEPPSNRPAPFRSADRVCAPDFYSAGAARCPRTTSVARSAPLYFFPRCLPDPCDARHADRTPASQTFLASAVSLRSSRTGLLHLHEPFHGAGLVSVHVYLLRRRHSLWRGIDSASCRCAISASGFAHGGERRNRLYARGCLAWPFWAIATADSRRRSSFSRGSVRPCRSIRD